jgi:hypothetical protein
MTKINIDMKTLRDKGTDKYRDFPLKAKRGPMSKKEVKEMKEKEMQEKMFDVEVQRQKIEQKKEGVRRRKAEEQEAKIRSMMIEKELLEKKHLRQLEHAKLKHELKLLKQKTSPLGKIQAGKLGERIRMKKRDMSLTQMKKTQTIKRKHPPYAREGRAPKTGVGGRLKRQDVE